MEAAVATLPVELQRLAVTMRSTMSRSTALDDLDDFETISMPRDHGADDRRSWAGWRGHRPIQHATTLWTAASWSRPATPRKIATVLRYSAQAMFSATMSSPSLKSLTTI